MLKVEKVQKGAGLHVHFTGTIDEGDDFGLLATRGVVVTF